MAVAAAVRRASLPPELSGLRRDAGRLMVVDRAAAAISHLHFRDLGAVLTSGDLLVVNSSRVVPSSIEAARESGERVQLRPWVRRAGRWDVLAVQPSAPHGNVPLAAGETLVIAGGLRAAVIGRRADAPLLWRLHIDGDGVAALFGHGEPIRYSYVPEPVALPYHQNVYATHPGSAESPSGGRAFTWELLMGLREAGVELADIVLHTGLSSFQDDAVDAEHLLLEEWFSVGEGVASAVERAARVIAVGTTVVRALESVSYDHRKVAPMSGWTSLAVRPGSEIRAVDCLLTGLHEPGAGHLDLIRAFVDEALLRRATDEAIEHGYLWHEFGDHMLIL